MPECQGVTDAGFGQDCAQSAITGFFESLFQGLRPIVEAGNALLIPEL
jgi:hypothetical protein